MLSKAIIKKLWPNAPAAKIAGIAKVAPAVFAEFDIEDPLIVAHIMAQISHENGAGTIVRENMNYRAPRIMEIFGEGRHSANVTESEAPRLAGKPKELSERVYGLGNPKKAKELGNVRPGDGWLFRGGGDLQLTGGEAYRRIGSLIGVDLYGHPELLEDPEISFRCAVAEFVKLNCVPAAKADNVVLVTKRVNGGKNGLAERTVWLRKWKVALPEISTPAEPEETPSKPTDLPPPVEPRGGETDQEKPAAKSKTLWAAIVAAVTSAVSGVLQSFADNPNPYLIGGFTVITCLVVFIARDRIKRLIDEVFE